MNISQKMNVTAVISVLLAFCFVTALSLDTTTALRGSSGSENENGRNLAEDKISVYRCDLDNQKITSTINNATEVLENAGLDVRICFQATRLATSNDLYLLKIDDFVFTKDRINGDLAAAGPTRQIPVIMRQKAVDHGIAMTTDLTEIFCNPGSEICALETRLTGYFFLTSGTIQGKGSVLMQRGKNERRELQQMDAFEDVSIELDFTGGGRNPIPPKKRIIIIVSTIILLFSMCCGCGIIFCCIAGICCFAGRDKREDSDDDNIEEVSVKIEWAPTVKSSKKDAEDGDLSETESLEDDQYWDDDIDLSEDENESNGNKSYDDSVENIDMETNGAAVVPVQGAEEESPKKKSKRKSKRNKSLEEEDCWDDDIDDSEKGNELCDKSVENLDKENYMEEVVPVQETEEEPPQKKKTKKKKSKKRAE